MPEKQMSFYQDYLQDKTEFIPTGHPNRTVVYPPSYYLSFIVHSTASMSTYSIEMLQKKKKAFFSLTNAKTDFGITVP
jgi:hypothetical protein